MAQDSIVGDGFTLPGMSSQQAADQALARWHELRGLPPEERIAIMMEDMFRAPGPLECEYEATLRRISEEIADAS